MASQKKMIITCPACSARYNLTAQQIGDQGRKVKCVKCEHVWHQEPVEKKKKAEKPKEKPPIAPESTTVLSSIEADLAADHAAHRKKMMSMMLIAAVVSFSLLGTAAYMMREQIALAKANIVAMVTGEEVKRPVDPMKGLVFGEIDRTLFEDGKNMRMEFRGTVTNTSKVIVQVPEIRVALLNSKGIEIDFWPAYMKTKKLLSGETASWVCRFLNPPMDQISEFQVSFAKTRTSL